jgi:hypothetical protein
VPSLDVTDRDFPLVPAIGFLLMNAMPVLDLTNWNPPLVLAMDDLRDDLRDVTREGRDASPSWSSLTARARS